MTRRTVSALAAAAAVAVAAAIPAAAFTDGTVQAVYHEGQVSFTVGHVEAVAVRVRIIEPADGAVVFDTGPVEGTRAEWPVADPHRGTFRVAVTAWNAAGEVVLSQTASVPGLDGIARADLAPASAVKTATVVDPIVLDGEVEIFSPRLVRLYDHGGKGGALSLYDESQHRTAFVEPDVDGAGGFLFVARDTSTFAAFAVDGNHDGSGNPLVGVYGSDGASLLVDATQTGDDEVYLAHEAVSAVEVLDEAGAAFIDSEAPVALTSSPLSIAARTVVAPAAGYVLAIGAVDIAVSHTAGSGEMVIVGLSTVPNTLPLEQDFQFNVPSGAGSGTWDATITPAAVFPVNAGSNTVYVVAYKLGSAGVTAWDRALSLVYVPTAHGTVSDVELATAGAMGDDDPSVPARGGLTPDEIAAEQAESAAFVRDRIAAELASLRLRMDAVAGRIGNGLQGTGSE